MGSSPTQRAIGRRPTETGSPGKRCCAALAALLAVLPAANAGALETVTFRAASNAGLDASPNASPDAAAQTVTGRVLASDGAGTVYLQQDDGAVWLIDGQQIAARVSDDRPFVPATPGAVADRLTQELPPGFRVYTTPHYLVAYRTSRGFARWTASLLERLHRAFVAYWRKRGFDLHEPEFPLVVIVHPDAASFARAAEAELGGAPGGIVGYYSLKTNRVAMYDLSGTQAGAAAGGKRPPRRDTMKQINRMLATPAAEPLVATIVHEATHQIAFNCGLQTRYADLPLWLLEGMAIYFEAPDLSSGRGWRGIGRVNRPRLRTFRRNLGSWNPGTLATLVSTNERLRDPRFAAAAYADAWALNFYLIKHRPEQYTAYVRMLSEKPALAPDTPEERLEAFRTHFGPPGEVQQQMLSKMSRLK